MKQMKQTVKHFVVMEKEKSWKHLLQLLQILHDTGVFSLAMKYTILLD